MVNKAYAQKGSAAVGIAIVLVIILLGVLSVLFWNSFMQKPSTKTDAKVASNQDAASRDSTRKKHAQQLASALLSIHLLKNTTPASSQQGLDSIATAASDTPITDPSTNKPYVFNSNQISMQLGEATFKINATCDNKISGSNGTGLIIDAGAKSVALAIKLESGTYACESNL